MEVNSTVDLTDGDIQKYLDQINLVIKNGDFEKNQIHSMNLFGIS